MNKLLLLTKTELLNMLANTNFRFSSNKRKAIGYISILIPAAIITYVFVMYSVAAFSSAPSEYAPFLFMLMLFSGFAVLIFLSFYGAYGHLFGFKDYDLLMSLPIKKSSIMASKLIAFILTDYFYQFFIMLPLIVVYQFYFPQGILFFVYAFIIFIFFPFIPITIASLASFLVNLFSRNSKYVNLIRNIFMVVLMIGVMVLVLGMQSLMMSNVIQLTDILNNFKVFLPMVYYAAMGIVEQNIVFVLITVGINAASLVIFILLANKLYVKLNGRMSVGYKIKNFKLKETKQDSVTFALFKREVKRYFSSVTYFINTAISPVLLLLGVIYFIFDKDNLMNTLALALNASPSEEMVVAAIAATMLFTTMLTTTTASSISLEGDRLWIIKSLPIPTSKIFLAKILLNLMVIVPASVLAIIIFGISIQLSIIWIVILIALQITYAVVNSLIGLILNLYFPKLQWDRDVMVVKNSMSVLIAIFFGMAFAGLIAFIGINLPSSISLSLYILIVLGIGVISIIGLGILLAKKGTQLFQQLY